MSLVPECRGDNDVWHFTIGSCEPVAVSVRRIDLAPYTTTLFIEQRVSGQAPLGTDRYISKPTLTVRLYHDVEMAEVVAWDNHRHWHSVYSYPNHKMYHRDEKLALNRFLGEWLVYCRKLGVSSQSFVNPLS